MFWCELCRCRSSIRVQFCSADIEAVFEFNVALQILKQYLSSMLLCRHWSVIWVRAKCCVCKKHLSCHICDCLRNFPTEMCQTTNFPSINNDLYLTHPKKSSKRSNLGSYSAYHRTHCSFCILFRCKHHSRQVSATMAACYRTFCPCQRFFTCCTENKTFSYLVISHSFRLLNYNGF